MHAFNSQSTAINSRRLNAIADESAQDSDTPPDSEWLIRRALQSDPLKGFELLYQRYYRPLCSHVTRLVYSRQISEDLVTDIFVQLWQDQKYAQINGSYRAYLFTAARNKAVNYLRWEFNRNPPAEPTESLDRADTVASDGELAFEELTNRIQHTLDLLPPQCRNVFILSRFDGRKNSEISQELSISIKTVEGHLTKALHRLRASLCDYWLIIPLLFVW